MRSHCILVGPHRESAIARYRRQRHQDLYGLYRAAVSPRVAATRATDQAFGIFEVYKNKVKTNRKCPSGSFRRRQPSGCGAPHGAPIWGPMWGPHGGPTCGRCGPAATRPTDQGSRAIRVWQRLWEWPRPS